MNNKVNFNLEVESVISKKVVEYQPLVFNPEEFMDTFEEDISIEQKQEYLELLWYIMVSFVDLGFDMNPDQSYVENSKKSI